MIAIFTGFENMKIAFKSCFFDFRVLNFIQGVNFEILTFNYMNVFRSIRNP
jgi:hypothetical protein